MSSDGLSARQSMYCREDLAGVEAVLGARHRLAGLGAHRFVGVVPDRLLVFLGDAEQHADHPHRHLRAEILDEVEAPGADERVEAAAQYSRILGSSALILRGVNIRASSLRWMSWIGGSSKISDARRNLHVRTLINSRMAPRAGAEGLVVHQRLVDVGEPADRVEVVLLVVVQRLLFAQPPEHRVRIGVEVDVVGVEVDSLNVGAVGTGCHGRASRWLRVA